MNMDYPIIYFLRQTMFTLITTVIRCCYALLIHVMLPMVDLWTYLCQEYAQVLVNMNIPLHMNMPMSMSMLLVNLSILAERRM